MRNHYFLFNPDQSKTEQNGHQIGQKWNNKMFGNGMAFSFPSLAFTVLHFFGIVTVPYRLIQVTN